MIHQAVYGFENKIQGETVLGNPSKVVLRSLKKSSKSLQKEIIELEKTILKLVKFDHSELLTRIKTIPGLGNKTALMLIVVTDGFERFDSASQLCSYAGLTPITRESGSSVNNNHL